MNYIRIVSSCLLLLVFGACKKDKVELSKAFIKYYGGIEVDKAADMAVTPDGGYVIVATTETEGNGGSDILVIRTDNLGNETWHKTFGSANDDYAGGIEITPAGGYIIAGTISHKANVFDPRQDSTSAVAILLDGSGNVIQQQELTCNSIFAGPGEVHIGTQGVDIQNIAGGGYIMTGIVDTAKIYDLYAVQLDDNLARVNTSDFFYGAYGVDDFPGKVAVTSTGQFVLSSSTKLGTTDADFTIRVVQFQVGGGVFLHNNASSKTVFDPSIQLGFAKEVIQLGGDNYAIVGSTYEVTAGEPTEQDLFFMRMNSALGLTGSITTFGEASSKEKGVAVCSTADGGFAVLGTTDNESTTGSAEKKTDIVLLKLNSNGGEEWKKTFGGIGDDDAVAVKQTDDGGYIICGTVDFGNNNDNSGRSNAIVLIKVNENGELSNVVE